jgi:hypothetical protein
MQVRCEPVGERHKEETHDKIKRGDCRAAVSGWRTRTAGFSGLEALDDIILSDHVGCSI